MVPEKEKQEKQEKQEKKATLTDMMALEATATSPVVTHDTSEMSMLFDSARFAQAWRVSRLLSSSGLVPEHYQNKPSNTFVALMMAHRLGMDPMMVMQTTYVVHGKFAIEAKLAIALINSSGLFDGPIQFRLSGSGDTRACTAFAKHSKSGITLEAHCSIQMAKDDGWYAKSGSKWKTLPDLMLQYRSAMFFGRLYCPERLLGMQSVDEVDDAIASDAASSKGAQVEARFVRVQSTPEGVDSDAQGRKEQEGGVGEHKKGSKGGSPAEAGDSDRS